GMKGERDWVLPDRLDRRIELDLAALDREATFSKQRGKIAGRHRAVELPGFRCLAQYREAAAFELLRDLLGLAAQLEIARLELRLHGFEARLVLLRGAQRLALSQQEVACIAVLDAHYVADLAEFGDTFEQNHFHRGCSIIAIGKKGTASRSGLRQPAPLCRAAPQIECMIGKTQQREEQHRPGP